VCFFTLLPCDVLSVGEGFLICFIFLVAFHREWSVDSVGVRPCRNVWMQSFLLLLRSCLSSCVAVLSNLLLSVVRNQCQPLQRLLQYFV
jgi:hypothetical protein